MQRQRSGPHLLALVAVGGAIAFTAKQAAHPQPKSAEPVRLGSSGLDALSELRPVEGPAPRSGHATLENALRGAGETSPLPEMPDVLVPLAKVPGLESYDWTVRLTTSDSVGTETSRWRFDDESGELLAEVAEIDRSAEVNYVLEVRTQSGRSLSLAPGASDSFSLLFGPLSALGIGATDPVIELGVRRFLTDEAQVARVAQAAFRSAQEAHLTVFPFPEVGLRYEWSIAPNPVHGVQLLTTNDPLLRSSSFDGKAYLLEVGASWCMPCRQLHRTLVDLASSHPHSLGIISVNIDNAELTEAASQVIAEQRRDAAAQDSWHLVRVPGDSEAWKLQAQALRGTSHTAVPIIVLVDNNGRVVSNSLRVDEVAAAVAELLSGSTSDLPKAPTVSDQSGNPVDVTVPAANLLPPELSRFTVPADAKRFNPLYIGVDLFEPDSPPESVVRLVPERNRVEFLRPFDGNFYQSLRAFAEDGSEVPLVPVNRDGMVLFRCDAPERLSSVVLYGAQVPQNGQ